MIARGLGRKVVAVGLPAAGEERRTVATGLRQDEDTAGKPWFTRRRLVVIGCLLLILIATTADVRADGLLRHWDRALMFGTEAHRVPHDYVAQHGLHLKSGWRFWLWRTIVWGGQYWLVASLCGAAAAVVAVRRRKPWLFVAVAAWVVGDQVAVWVFKKLMGRTFPGSGRDLLFTTSQAYPSGHSALGASCLIVLAALVPAVLQSPGTAPAAGLGPRVVAWLSGPGRENRASAAAERYALTVATVLAVLVAIATVMLGYHWPTDAIAGWAYGLLIALVGYGLVRYFE